MKKVLLFGSILCLASSVWAFGGIGIGPWQRHKNQGVDIIGIHIDPNGKKADIITCGDNEEPWEDKCLPKCEDGRERNTDGSCTVCANGNVYLSYMDDPCGTDTPMNQISCESDNDCWDQQPNQNCCDKVTYTCKAGFMSSQAGSPDLIMCPEADNRPCKSNKDCQTGEFCEITNHNWENCEIPNVGTCARIGEYTDSDENDAITHTFGVVRISNNPMYWWAAENWCKAQNMRLFDISDFGCYKSGSHEPITAGSEYAGDCYPEGWDNDSILAQIKQTFPDLYPFWTSSNYSSNPCSVYTIANTAIFEDERYGDVMWGELGYNYRALCKSK